MKSPTAVLWWHLHQPDYREPGGERAWFPWVRMHALRGYTDLVVQALERGPRGMTINIVPSLADQLLDLAEGRVEDRHHRLARLLAEGDDAAQQEAFRAHAAPSPRPIHPTPEHDELHAKARVGHRASRQEALDACVLFHLRWAGFTMAARPEVAELIRQERDYSAEDLLRVLAVSREMAAEVIPRLARARSEGAVHLTTTPYMHPILPLLIDTASAHEATSDGGAPPPFAYRSDALDQVRSALDRHEALFGHRPRAMWPAEGALSEAAAEVLAEAGVEVAASDEELLRKSLQADDRQAHLAPWEHERTGLKLLFRDRQLSDDWGFVYRDMEPAEAALAFVSGVRHRAGQGEVVPVILDGENPFEQYPDAGRRHLDAFARAADGMELVSPEEAAERRPRKLSRLATGSWIYARLDIWAGDEEDRRGWALLKAVREAIDLDALEGEARDRAKVHLYAAEGSDWFWWYGPEFSIPDKAGFDALFRRHLEEACHAAGLDPLAVAPLDRPVVSAESMGRGRRALPIGRPPDEGWQKAGLGPWANALHLESDADRGAMHRGDDGLLRAAWVLASPEELFVRIAAGAGVEEVSVELLSDEGELLHRERVEVAGPPALGDGDRPAPVVAIPWSRAGVEPGQPVGLKVRAVRGELAEVAPGEDPARLSRPLSTWFEA